MTEGAQDDEGAKRLGVATGEILRFAQDDGGAQGDGSAKRLGVAAGNHLRQVFGYECWGRTATTLRYNTSTDIIRVLQEFLRQKNHLQRMRIDTELLVTVKSILDGLAMNLSGAATMFPKAVIGESGILHAVKNAFELKEGE